MAEEEVFDITDVEPDPVASEHFHAEDSLAFHGEDKDSIKRGSEVGPIRSFASLLATTTTPAKFVAALRAEGVKVVGVTKNGVAWTNHSRPASLGAFDPHGVLNHHTGPFSTVSGMVSLLWNGRSDLPGPLAHVGLAPDGTAYMVGWNRANHAGKGDKDTYNAILNETGVFPKPNYDSVDGNSKLYGIEVMHKGDSSAYTDAQIQALVKINAAIERLHGWTYNSSAHHKEWTHRKTDMSWHGAYAGRDLRLLIKACLAKPAGVWTLNAVPAPPPPLTTVTVYKFGTSNAWYLPLGTIYEHVVAERAAKWTANNVAVRRIVIPETDPRYKVKRITY
jgi:hypothetical protein